VAVVLLPVLVGIVVIRRRATGGLFGIDGLRVVIGMLSFFAILCIVIGVLGRFDLAIAGLLTIAALRWFWKTQKRLAS
jgi:hypothetical protein